MSFGYRWMLDEEPYAYLRSLRPTHRRRLEGVLDSLATHPFTEPSFIDFDSEGEELFHCFAGGYTVIYHLPCGSCRAARLDPANLPESVAGSFVPWLT